VCVCVCVCVSVCVHPSFTATMRTTVPAPHTHRQQHGPQSKVGVLAMGQLLQKVQRCGGHVRRPHVGLHQGVKAGQELQRGRCGVPRKYHLEKGGRSFKRCYLQMLTCKPHMSPC
jgi:hypothetical protein